MSNEKICKGCGRLNLQPLGLNEDGEPYLACCPESNYVEVKKQSSVEWLIAQLIIEIPSNVNRFRKKKVVKNLSIEQLMELQEQAKAMHETEQKEAYERGFEDSEEQQAFRAEFGGGYE